MMPYEMPIQLSLWLDGVRFAIDFQDGVVTLESSNLAMKEKERVLPAVLLTFRDYVMPVLLTNWTYAPGHEVDVSYVVAGFCDLVKIQEKLVLMGEHWEIKDGILVSPECSKVQHRILMRLIRSV